jgi:hypothetical protein
MQSVRSENKHSRSDISRINYDLSNIPNHNSGGYSSGSRSQSPNSSGNLKRDSVCFKCNKPGHFARQCPTMANDRSDDGRDRQISLSKHVKFTEP